MKRGLLLYKNIKIRLDPSSEKQVKNLETMINVQM